jgi:hypothetical protein
MTTTKNYFWLPLSERTEDRERFQIFINRSDLFVMLFCTKVGNYTEEEFETAFGSPRPPTNRLFLPISNTPKSAKMLWQTKNQFPEAEAV